MATRASLDDKLAALRGLRRQVLTPEQQAALKGRIDDRSNLVVAAAAAIVGENMLVGLAKDLEAAYHRFLVNPLKEDKLCRAKIAVVHALDKIEHRGPDVFLQAAKYEQFEPVWGTSEDSAPPLRAAAIVALARIEGASCLPLLVDAMVDPSKDVRIASGVALGAVGTEAAGLILRLKVRVGDLDPDVLSECLGALLAVDPDENLPLVADHLAPSNPTACEAAALALGKSRLPGALDPLKDCSERCHSPDLKQQVFLAIAILRRPGAAEYLMEIVGSAAEPTAIAALLALRIYKADPRICERIGRLVGERGSPKLQASFDRDFRSGES